MNDKIRIIEALSMKADQLSPASKPKMDGELPFDDILRPRQLEKPMGNSSPKIDQMNLFHNRNRTQDGRKMPLKAKPILDRTKLTEKTDQNIPEKQNPEGSHKGVEKEAAVKQNPTLEIAVSETVDQEGKAVNIQPELAKAIKDLEQKKSASPNQVLAEVIETVQLETQSLDSQHKGQTPESDLRHHAQEQITPNTKDIPKPDVRLESQGQKRTSAANMMVNPKVNIHESGQVLQTKVSEAGQLPPKVHESGQVLQAKDPESGQVPLKVHESGQVLQAKVPESGQVPLKDEQGSPVSTTKQAQTFDAHIATRPRDQEKPPVAPPVHREQVSNTPLKPDHIKHEAVLKSDKANPVEVAKINDLGTEKSTSNQNPQTVKPLPESQIPAHPRELREDVVVKQQAGESKSVNLDQGTSDNTRGMRRSEAVEKGPLSLKQADTVKQTHQQRTQLHQEKMIPTTQPRQTETVMHQAKITSNGPEVLVKQQLKVEDPSTLSTDQRAVANPEGKLAGSDSLADKSRLTGTMDQPMQPVVETRNTTQPLRRAEQVSSKIKQNLIDQGLAGQKSGATGLKTPAEGLAPRAKDVLPEPLHQSGKNPQEAQEIKAQMGTAELAQEENLNPAMLTKKTGEIVATAQVNQSRSARSKTRNRSAVTSRTDSKTVSPTEYLRSRRAERIATIPGQNSVQEQQAEDLKGNPSDILKQQLRDRIEVLKKAQETISLAQEQIPNHSLHRNMSMKMTPEAGFIQGSVSTLPHPRSNTPLFARSFAAEMVEKIRDIGELQNSGSTGSKNSFVVDAGPMGELDIEFNEEASKQQITIFVESENARHEMQRVLPHIEDNLNQRGFNFTGLEVEIRNHQRESETTQQQRSDDSTASGRDLSTSETLVDDEIQPTANRNYGYNTMEVVA